MAYDWKTIKFAKEFIEESRKEKFPYFMNPYEVFGLKIQVNQHVFSPKKAQGYKFFIPKLPKVKGLKVLEIGCGHGIVACYLAREAYYVLAVDINEYAVEDTKINAKYNNLKNLEAKKSDVFSNIKENEKFDIIFWNLPWAKVPKNFEKHMNIEDYGVFDVEYKSVSNFILNARKYLTPKGFVYMFYSVEGADEKQIETLIQKAKFNKKIISNFIFEEEAGGKPLKYHAKLLKLS